jgi:hypothetical protein
MNCPKCTRGTLLLIRELDAPDFKVNVTKCDLCGIKVIYPQTPDGARRIEWWWQKQCARIERGEA